MQHIGRQFIELTKHKHLGFSPQQQGEPMPPLETPVEKAEPPISLTKPQNLGGQVGVIIDQRVSRRQYSPTPLTQDELSWLLWCTQGVKQVSHHHTFRTVPSAGARHAFETCVLVNRVENLAPGLYRFLATEHSLVPLNLAGDMGRKIKSACLNQGFIQTCGAVFIWVAVVERMTWRYQQRGYRYLFLDIGHVCQNLYLAAEAIDCGVCAVAAYDDDRMNELLGLDGDSQFVIYLAAAGKIEP